MEKSERELLSTCKKQWDEVRSVAANYSQFHQQSRKMALCGVMTALSVVILTLGSLVPLSTFLCPMLATMCLIPTACEYGTGTSLLLYTGVSVLGLLLCPDKEIAMLYLFLGWYPTVQSRLDTLPRFLCIAVKCGLFSLSMVVMYAILLYLFQMEEIVAEFAEYSTAMNLLMLALGNVTFLLYCRAMKRLSALYRIKRKIG